VASDETTDGVQVLTYSIKQSMVIYEVKEIWKYNHSGGNRYGLRITIENGEVIGWDKKD
jgi:hypothetical protein